MLPQQMNWEDHYVLNLGCGRKAKMNKGVNVDIDPACSPDLVWDLNKLPLPFEDNTFERCIISHVFEHLGDPWAIKMPYVEWFFKFWKEIWRVLKPYGIVQFVAPNVNNEMTWGDPGHVHAVTPQTLYFLNKSVYEENKKITYSAMTQYGIDFSFDFELGAPVLSVDKSFVIGVLRAVKPAQETELVKVAEGEKCA